MQLEDHIGDVLGKARAGKGLSRAEVGAAGQLSEAGYAELEEKGVVAAAVDWGGVGKVLELSGERLARLAAGWVPAKRDTGIWRELRVITTDRGMAVNCYLIWDEVTRDAALFDTGWDAGPVLELIGENGLVLRHIFITHGHRDHVAALEELRREYPKARLHSSAADAPVEQRNRANDFLHLGSLRITNRSTPGHAVDGVTYVIGTWPEDAPNVAMVGDALFAGSMGGAGLELGNARRAVKEQILSLPKDTLVCPGHGPLTTVGEEAEMNPFFS